MCKMTLKKFRPVYLKDHLRQYEPTIALRSPGKALLYILQPSEIWWVAKYGGSINPVKTGEHLSVQKSFQLDNFNSSSCCVLLFLLIFSYIVNFIIILLIKLIASVR